MALNPVLKLQILGQTKAGTTRVRAQLAQVLQALVDTYPLAATQLQTLLAPIDAAFVTALASITTAQANTAAAITQADQVAFATQAATDAQT